MACHFIEGMATKKKTEEKQKGCRLTLILTAREREKQEKDLTALPCTIALTEKWVNGSNPRDVNNPNG